MDTLNHLRLLFDFIAGNARNPSADSNFFPAFKILRSRRAREESTSLAKHITKSGPQHPQVNNDETPSAWGVFPRVVLILLIICYMLFAVLTAVIIRHRYDLIWRFLNCPSLTTMKKIFLYFHPLGSWLLYRRIQFVWLLWTGIRQLMRDILPIGVLPKRLL